jgi:hypothetical protein
MAAIGVLVALLTVAGFVLWQRGAFTNEYPDVPSCPELAKTLPAAAGGSWAVSKPDPSYGRRTRSTTICELSFISADQRFSGNVFVSISGNANDEALRQKVRDARCDGSMRSLDTASDGYLAVKACDGTFGEVDHANVLAAKDPRRVDMVVRVVKRHGSHVEALSFARSLVRTVADQGLTIPASE